MTRRRLAFAAVAAVLVILFGGRWLALRYTEYLWFAELQQGPRWIRLLLRGLSWRAAIFGAALLWYATNLLAVYRSIGSVQLPRRLGNLEIAEAVPPRLLRVIAIGAAAALAFATAWTFGDLDHYVALWRHAAPIGLADPVLRRDASYYLATLPLFEVLHLLLSLTATFGFVLVITLYAATGSLTIVNRRPRITPHARTHLVVLMAVLALAAAIGFRLDTAELVGGGGSLSGALSTVDRGVRLPVADALAVLSLLVAVGTMFAMRWSRTTPLVAMWATLGLAALIGRWLVPVVAESWGRPDAAVARALADYADDYTRDAFGLVGAEKRPLGAGHGPPEQHTAAVLAGVVPWSGEPRLLESALRGATGDTLGVRSWATAVLHPGWPDHGPLVLAVPQLDLFESAARGLRFDWRELHRGAAAWGGEPVAGDGALRAGPLRFVSSLGGGDLQAAPMRVLQPERVRIVPGAAGLGIVGPDESAVGRPAPGVLLAGPLRRLLLAWALQAPPLLDDHTSAADRVLYWRDVPARLDRLFPFALFDPARPAVLDGRLVWVADGYLVSSRFPMAEHVRWGGDDVNYVAAAYLAVVDAASGVARLYERPDAGVFARSVARSEGVLPLPADSLPSSLTAQLTYPAGLFGAQAAVLAHLGAGPDDRDWTLVTPDSAPARRDAARLLPTQALVPLGDEPPALWSFAPMNDGAGTALRAIAAGTTGPGGRLRFVVLRAGTNEPLPTPQAAAARIAVSPAFAAMTTLGGRDENRRGPVLVVPVPGGVAYVQVLFTAMPGGRGFVPTAIAVAADGRVGVGGDAASAVAGLEHGDADSSGPQSQAALAQARAAFAALDSARRAGDWAAFGRAWDALRQALGARP